MVWLRRVLYLIYLWKYMQVFLGDRVGKLGCVQIVDGFMCQVVIRFNLVDEREIVMDFEMRNEMVIVMFEDDYFGNGMQEELMEE